jgi:hypothetical protein
MTLQRYPGGTVAGFAKEILVVSDTAVGFTASKFAPKAGAEATYALVTVEDDDIRYWLDGSAPTSSLGHLVPDGNTFEIHGPDNIRNFRAIRTNTDATLQVSYFR